MNLISELKNISASNLIEIFIPSLKSTRSFNQLNAKQLKDCFKHSVDGAVAGVNLQNTLTDIINNNSTTSEQYNVIDRTQIAVHLRANALGNKYNEFDLTTLLDQNINVIESKTINYKDVISIDISTPLINIDKAVNASHLESLKQQEQLSDIIGELYIYEIVKFIQAVRINDEDIKWNELKITEQRKVVDNFPAQLNSEILRYIKLVRTEEQKYLTNNNNILSIDSLFFAVD